MKIGSCIRVLAAASALFVGGTIVTATNAEARTNRAVLVAVTKYPNVQGADLVGPNNDAQLVREFLTTRAPVPFAPENVTVLADDLDGATASPTLQAIVDALAGVADKSERGDFVYLHFSGHGIQQPAADVTSEPDGLDEVFLPADIKPWVDRSRGIPSAFPDDDIGKAVQAIRDKGAFVWIVIDACHSGTATRSLDGDVTYRKIDPDQLGIPGSAFKEAVDDAGWASRSVAPKESRALALYAKEATDNHDDSSATGAESIVPGGMVAFFAAQTVETTPEMPLPRGAEDARKLGLFTYTLFSRIAENPAQSYRQLGQSVMQEYAAQNRSRPTPLFEGNLDTPVFGTSGGAFVQQWKVTVEPNGITIPAGSLHRLTPGTKLALLKSPADAIEDAIGYAEVSSAETLTSKIATVAVDGNARLGAGNIPESAYARLAEISFDTQLVVSRPTASTEFADKVSEANSLLDAIVANEDAPVKIKVVDPGDSADIRLAVLSEQEVALLVADAGSGAQSATVGSRAAISDEPRLWFLPPTAEVSLTEGRRPPSIGFAGSTPDGLQQEVADHLTRMFRATNLARLAAANNFDTTEFVVNFNIKRAGAGESERLETGTMPLVHPGDQVHLEAHNRSGRPVDINVLYVGSDYSIGHMYAERLHDGSDVDEALLEFNDTSYGVERMIVVLTEGSAITTTEDLGFLEQEGVRMMTRSAAYPEGFSGLLRDIGSAPATRGAMKLGKSPRAKGAVLIFPLENMPPG
ncbi:MAG: caspase family protein [Rhizobiaceae bacterium]